MAIDRTTLFQCSQYGIYTTRIGNGPGGDIECDILQDNHQIRTIQGFGRVRFIFSPGFELEPPQA